MRTFPVMPGMPAAGHVSRGFWHPGRAEGCVKCGDSFTCPRCGAVSHHPEDGRQGYCGRCHDFTGREEQP